MRFLMAVGMVVTLGCLSAAQAAQPASEYQTYGGIRADSDPVLLAKFEKAVRYCEPRIASWLQPPPIENKYIYVAALRSCLYRHDFISRGAYAYPVNAWYEHLIDR